MRIGRGILWTMSSKRGNPTSFRGLGSADVGDRYPTFQVALQDLDDALSMLFLFSNLPTLQRIDAEIIRNCERLCAEFQHYVIQSNSLRKCFLSIKGIYYQAEIEGETITWIVPYKFSQHVSPFS